jgi:flavin-binding protein dodecin
MNRAAANRGKERAAASQIRQRTKLEEPMSNSVYKIIELVGTSTESWEDAARAAVERASSSLRDLRIAEVVKLDLQIKDGKVEAYRAKVSVSFKYEDKE